MKLKDGMKFKKVELEVDPLQISYAQALSEGKKIRNRLGDCVLKFNYCGQKVVIESNKRNNK